MRGIICTAAIAAVVATTSPARGQSGHHGHGHDRHHDWYRDLKQPHSNASCCNKLLPDGTGDCRPVRAYLGDDGRWRAIIDGRRLVIPADKVLTNPDGSALVAPDGNSHACVSPHGIIYCFIGAVPKS
jgi:hypothetical protein